MGYDGLYMRKVIKEISEKIEGRLRNVYQLSGGVYYLDFKKNGVKISLKPDSSYMVYVEDTDYNAIFPSSFVMLLRKILKNSRFLKVSQDGYTRVAVFEFEKPDEFGDLRRWKLYVEIMGKFSNMILVDDKGMIVDAYRRIVTSKGREILPGKVFLPYPSNKQDPFNVDFSFLRPNVDVEKQLVKNIEGVSLSFANEVVYRAGSNEVSAIKNAWEDLMEEYLSYDGGYLFLKNSVPIDFSAVKLLHLGNIECIEDEPSKTALMFFKYKEDRDRFLNKKTQLISIVNKNLKKLNTLNEKLWREYKKTEDYETFKKFGELLKAYSYNIKSGKDTVELYDWEENKTIQVPLKGLDPIVASQKYFKVYKKKKKTRETLKKRLKELTEEIEYLESVLNSIENSETFAELEEIEEELEVQGIVKKSKKKKKGKENESRPIKVQYNGFIIYIGKNNRQNDELVRNASDEDIWLHAHEIPGAHVIIKTQGKEVDEDTLKYAASLAAGYSKGKDSGNVPVDYTLIKYVRKPKGLKPGMVLYSNYKTFIVKPIRIDRY